MKFIKKSISILLALTLMLGMFPMQSMAAKKTVVESRLAEVQEVYPQDSAFDEWVRVTNWLEYGGCTGLVAYATEKIFHDAYYDGSDSYTQIGKASTSSTDKMKKLFKKAKIGDVIKWSQKGEGTHYAIFLSDSSTGVYIYEANFGGPNQVWYNHFWRWGVMKEWPVGGANEVYLYRAENYNAVNNKKAALKTPVGTVLTVNEELNLQVKVVDNSIHNGAVVVLDGYAAGTKIPKGISLAGEYVLTYDTKAACMTGDANSYEYFDVVTYDDLKPAKVKKPTVTNSSKKTLKVTWKKIKGATGYEVYRATEKNGTYKLVKALKGESKVTYTNKNLKKGKTFYYKVRAYKQVGNEKIYGDFSKVVSKKVKK